MSIEQLFVFMIVVFAAVIAMSLAVTHRYIKSIYQGINYLSMGVVFHIFGFMIYTGVLINIDWVKYFIGNGAFIYGTLLLHKGLDLFTERKHNYVRVYSIVGIGAILGILFFFVEENMAYRHNLISVIIIYLVFEIFYSIIHTSEKVKKVLRMPVYAFCSLFIILMIGRFVLVNNSLLQEPLPSGTMTFHMLSNIIGGILFVILGFMISVIINVRAITDLKAERQSMELISLTDHLTGLPNRLGLEKYVNDIKDKTHPYAVIFADFDEFKKVNDKYGHIIGDRVIIEFSKALLSVNDENMFTARYGGDEFVTIVKRFDNEDHLKEAIERRIKSIGSSIKVNEYVFDLTISVGVAIYPEHGTDIYSLIGKADSALGQIKLNGKNNIRFYQQP